MAYTVTKSTSWFERLGSSFRGIVTGLILIVVGTALLWWNEGNFVQTGDALTEAQGVTQELGDISMLNTSMNGQLVHATGDAKTEDILTDPILGVSVNAIRLERTVEFYQWVEHSREEKRQKLGGGEETVTTYTYEQEWVSSPVSSDQFMDPDAVKQKRNFVLSNLENVKIQANNVSFGAYRLPEFLISSISGATPLAVSLSDEVKTSLNQEIRLALSAVHNTSGVATQPTQQTSTDAFGQLYARAQEQKTQTISPEQDLVHVRDNTVIFSTSPGVPQIGDVRITFTKVLPGTVSILAKVIGDTFEQYQAANGKTVSQLSMGTHSLENMYGDAHSANTTMTWILRFVGVVVIIIGLKMVLAPLAVVASVIPLLGSIVGAGSGLASTLLGTAWSLIVIAIAWLRFRPIIGGAMVLAAGVLIAIVIMKGRGKNALVSDSETPAPKV